VRNILGTEHEVARSGGEPLAVTHECHASLEYIKGLVFTVMNMVRRFESGRQYRVLNESEGAVRAVALRSVVTPKNWKGRSSLVFRYAWGLFAITRAPFSTVADLSQVFTNCPR
jgi:hypothetical protein